MQDETPQLTPQPILPAPATVPPKPANKTALIMIATAVAVLLFIGVSLWLWSGAAKSDFTKSTATYLQKAKEAYDYYRDTEKPSSHVDDIIAKFDAAIATKPQVPQVLGVAPADAGDVEKVNTITTQLTNLREDFSAYHQYEAYGQAVLKIMGTSTASISTIDDLRAAKPLFSQAATKLQALGTPKGAGTFQSALEKAYTKWRHRRNWYAGKTRQNRWYLRPVAGLANGRYRGGKEEVKSLRN